MTTKTKKWLTSLLAQFSLGVGLSFGVINIDFTATTLVNQGNGYIGGNFSGQIDFEEWVGDSQNVSIGSGVLTVDSGFVHSAVFAVESSALDGPGEYEMVFDVTGIVTGSNNNGIATVWSGSGYDLTLQSQNGLFIDTRSLTTVTGQGTATATQLGSLVINSTGTNQSIAFTYDGTSALIFALGAQTVGAPFPTVEYDNFRVNAVPEPATVLLMLPIAAFVFLRRRVI